MVGLLSKIVRCLISHCCQSGVADVLIDTIAIWYNFLPHKYKPFDGSFKSSSLCQHFIRWRNLLSLDGDSDLVSSWFFDTKYKKEGRIWSFY